MSHCTSISPEYALFSFFLFYIFTYVLHTKFMIEEGMSCSLSFSSVPLVCQELLGRTFPHRARVFFFPSPFFVLSPLTAPLYSIFLVVIFSFRLEHIREAKRAVLYLLLHPLHDTPRAFLIKADSHLTCFVPRCRLVRECLRVCAQKERVQWTSRA